MEASAAKEKDKGGKKMSRVGSWGSMAFYSSSSSSRSQPVSAAEGKNGGKKEKRRSSISRSITCAGSICSTKESSVSSRGRGRRRRSGGGGGGDGGGGGSTSSRSLMGPGYHGDSAAAVSASSSFNSVMTAATFATATTTTTTTSSSATSPPSALSSPLSSIGGSFRAMQIRKLSGCYLHCHSVLDPRTLAAVFSCPDCDEVFVKPDSLELHRSTRHAELGADDTSRNIVEIIFQSSWLKKNAPVCRIERILKVQSSDKTIKRFEQHKEAVKEKARSAGDEAGRNPRCVADGNELLRFHCTTFACSLGLAGGTALCCASSVDGNGRITTMATSGRAHDTAEVSPDGEKRAMLVCRVVAGRVKKLHSSNSSEDHDCDSVSPCSEGVYSDLDELFVFSPRAILPCFIVIYSGY
uniref:C2H2-type domain-containing protein n=1 Tax=Oryza nivara TaxID=4536 RepID=A0A0E0IYQ6_ORYNI